MNEPLASEDQMIDLLGSLGFFDPTEAQIDAWIDSLIEADA